MVEKDEDYKMNKKAIETIHKYKPKYIFLTETSSINPGYSIKEALRKAYPNEPLPKFYRVDPRAVLDVIESKGKVGWKSYFESEKIKLEEFFKKRIKDKNAPILVYDEDWNTGRSPGLILSLLKNPQRYGFSEDNKSPNVKVNTYERQRPIDPEVLQELQIDSSDFLPDSTVALGRMYSDEITTKRDSRRGYDFRGRIGHPRNLDLIRKSKQKGSKFGKELHAELEKQHSLEQKVSSVVAIAGIFSSLFFLSSNVTGNAIADLSTKTTSFLGAGLLIVGLVAGFFFLKSRK